MEGGRDEEERMLCCKFSTFVPSGISVRWLRGVYQPGICCLCADWSDPRHLLCGPHPLRCWLCVRSEATGEEEGEEEDEHVRVGE